MGRSPSRRPQDRYRRLRCHRVAPAAAVRLPCLATKRGGSCPFEGIAMRLLAAAALFVLLAAPAAAFPDRPITIVLPYSPGSAADAYARALGDHMARALGQ